MPDRVPAAIRSVAAAVSLLGVMIAFVLAGSMSASPRLVFGAAAVGAVALCVAAGPRALVSVFVGATSRGDGEGGQAVESTWWLARFEPAVESVWTRWADYTLLVGLVVVAVGAFATVATSEGSDPPIAMLVLGFLCTICAFLVLAMTAMDE